MGSLQGRVPEITVRTQALPARRLLLLQHKTPGHEQWAGRLLPGALQHMPGDPIW